MEEIKMLELIICQGRKSFPDLKFDLKMSKNNHYTSSGSSPLFAAIGFFLLKSTV